MKHVYFYHRHNLHRLAKHPDFYNFEFAIWLHTVASSLIAIFVPVLLYTLGYSINSILIFYLIFYIIDIPLNFFTDILIRKIGSRKVMILGTLAAIAFFGFLGLLPPNNWSLLIILAFIAALYDTFFWVTHIYIFIEANRDGLDSGKSVGSLASVRKLAGIAGPIIGAVILLTFGKLSLAIVSVVIFALSIIPLYKMHHLRDKPEGKRPSFKNFYSQNQERKDYLMTALLGVHNFFDSIIWPLYIFVVIGTIGSVAAIPVIIAFTTALFSYVTGKLTNKYSTRLIIVGSLVLIASWFLRISLTDPLTLFATVFIVGIFSLFVTIPVETNITKGGLRIESLSAATYQNTASMIFGIPVMIVLLLFTNIFGIGFAIAAVSVGFIIILMIIFSQLNRLQAKKLT